MPAFARVQVHALTCKKLSTIRRNVKHVHWLYHFHFLNIIKHTVHSVTHNIRLNLSQFISSIVYLVTLFKLKQMRIQEKGNYSIQVH